VATVEELDQRYALMPADVKDAYMVHIIDTFLEKNKSSSIIIFTSTCKYVLFSFNFLSPVFTQVLLLHRVRVWVHESQAVHTPLTF
jgi:ATP-dependent RNA helicase DDX49/DBP8